VTNLARSIAIEDLVREYPVSVHFMIEKGLPCLMCGEPAWGSFEEVARRSGKSEPEIDLLLEELRSRVLAEGGR